MGLLFQFPVDPDDPFVKKDGKETEVSSYGLPMIFLAYSGIALALLFLLTLAISSPLKKLMNISNDLISILIVGSTILLIALVPFVLLALHTYKKTLSIVGSRFIVKESFLALHFRQKAFNLKKGFFEVKHQLDAPNVARLDGGQELRAYQNQGHWVLIFRENNVDHFIDRSSKKSDLEKLVKILTPQIQGI